jgi:para-nitrobenzyl esterase
VSATRAEAFGRALAASGGVAPTVAGLSTLSEERLLALQKKATQLGPSSLTTVIEEGLPLGPTIDGDLLPRPTRESLRAGVGADKPLVIGATDDEFTMAFAGKAAKALRWVPQSVLLSRFGVPKSIRAEYLAANADVVRLGKARLAGRVLTDRMFRTTVPGIAADRGDAPTWLYLFSWPSGRFGFAEHCLDVPFFFDCLDGPALEALAGPNPPQTLADEVHGAAVSFITTGDPGWPLHEGDAGIVRVYDEPTRDVADAYASVRALL